MRGDNGDLIRGEVQRLKLPKWELSEQWHCVSYKTNSFLQLNLFFLQLSECEMTTHNSCQGATSVCGPPTTETILWDWLFLFVPCSPAEPLLDFVYFPAYTFQSGVTLKLIDIHVFTAASAVALDENNRWVIRLRPLPHTSPTVTHLPVKSSKPVEQKLQQLIFILDSSSEWKAA